MLQRGLRVVNEPGKIVELDDRAMDLVERYDEENRARHEGRGIEVSDIVNGAIRSILESDLEGDTILCRDVEEAMQARNGISNDDHEEKSEVETEEEEGTATGKTADHAQHAVHLQIPGQGRTPRALPRDRVDARADGDGAESRGSLWPEPSGLSAAVARLESSRPTFVLGDGSGKLANLLRAEHIAFACFDEALLKRIKRAAQSCGVGVDEYVADAVRRDVDCEEEEMIVHPQTGEVICDRGKSLLPARLTRLRNRCGVGERSRQGSRQPVESPALAEPGRQRLCQPKFSADTWAVLEEMAEKMGMDIGSAILRLVEEGLTERRMVKPPATVELDERAAALVSRYSEQWGNEPAESSTVPCTSAWKVRW